VVVTGVECASRQKVLTEALKYKLALERGAYGIVAQVGNGANAHDGDGWRPHSEQIPPALRWRKARPNCVPRVILVV
jgi:hypothetical protein